MAKEKYVVPSDPAMEVEKAAASVDLLRDLPKRLSLDGVVIVLGSGMEFDRAIVRIKAALIRVQTALEAQGQKGGE